RIVPEILTALPDARVIVVDDESPDGTAAVVTRLAATDSRVQLVNHRPRLGIGPAYKEGFRVAVALGAEHVIQMDADFSHPPAQLPALLAEAARYDLVLGSRYVKGITVVNWPIERLLISYFGNAYARRVTGLPLRDVTGGFKCWRRAALEAVNLSCVRCNGYAFQIEMTYRACRPKCSRKEIPIIFMDRTVGDSKMTKRISMEALWIVWWLRFADLFGRL